MAFFARALFTGAVLLPLDVLFLYPPWRPHAAEFGITVPNNHLIADTILQNYSWKVLAARAYAGGQLPLWNPYILAGEPFLAAAQNGSLYPLGVLFYLLPDGQAYGWFAALHLAIGGGLTYWFLRVLGASRFGALVGGTTFAFCGYLVVSVLWPMVISTAVWLPGVLAVVERLVRGRGEAETRRRGDAETRGHGESGLVGSVPHVLVGAGVVTLQFLAGHLEMSLYLLLTAGLYAAPRLAGQLFSASPCLRVSASLRSPASPDPRVPASPRLRVALTVALLLATVALGALGAAVQLLPFAEAISANVRGGQVSFEDVRSYALPREQLVAFLAPDFFGNPSHHALFDIFAGARRALDRPISEGPDQHLGTEWGAKNYVEGTAYLGILPLFLAAIALVRRRDAATWTLAGVAAVSLLLAFGTPLYGLLFYGLPSVDQLHTPFRWVYPFSFCLAALAGLGATEIERRVPASPRLPVSSSPPRAIPPSPHLPISVLALGILALGLVAAAWLWRDSLLGIAERAMASSRPLAMPFPDAGALYSYELLNMLGLALLLLASGLVLLALWRKAPGAKALALALLVGDLFSFGVGFNTASDPALLRFTPPAIQAIQADRRLFRIATLGEADTLPANTGMLFGLQDIRGYDTIILRDYVAFLELIEPQRGLLYSKVDKLYRPESLDSPLLDLLNVKYVLTSERIERPGWRLVHDGETRVYRNETVLPRAFLVEQAVVAANQGEALRLLAQPDFDPRRQVIVETTLGAPLAPPALPTPAGAVLAPPASPAPRIASYGPNRVHVEALALRPSYLVLSDVHFSGWTVAVDGVEQPLLRADGIFRAVQIPTGLHQVVFEYRPLSFRLGGVLSALAAALAVFALGIWGYSRIGLSALAESGTAGRVLKNSIVRFGTNVLNRSLDVLFALVYFRVLGPEGVGAYTFAVVVVGYFDILVHFGLGTLLTRDVARDPTQADRYFGNILVARLCLAGLAVLGALALTGPLAGPLAIGPDVGLAIVLFTLGLLPAALAYTSSAMFNAWERMEVPAAVTVVSTVSRVGLGVGVLLAGYGVVGLAAVSLLVTLLSTALLFGSQIAVLGRPRLQLNPAFCLALLALSWPLLLNDFLNNVFFHIDAILLKLMAGEVALGHYSTGYKFIDALQIIPSTFVLALFPVLSRQAAGHLGGLVRAFSLGLKVLMVLALPISVGTTLLAEPIIELFAGPAFLSLSEPDAAQALQVLIWFLPFGFVNGITQYVLIALNRQRWITLCFFVGAAVNIALNLLLIPSFGFMGAAVVTVISEWVLLAPFWYAVRKSMPPVPLLALAWRPTLAACIMGLAVLWARDINTLLAVPIGALVYVLVLLALGTLTREELRLLRGEAAA